MTTTIVKKRYQTMRVAYQQICDGVCDPWIALGNFRNAWYGHAKDKRPELVSEPLIQPEHPTRHTRNWGAFCAAAVEFLCDRYGVPCPEWVHDPQYTLSRPWYGDLEEFNRPVVRKMRKRESQPPFAKRKVYHGNRLFQNKYEMSTWMVEARAMGLSPIDAWRYSREKEIAIHGG